MPKDPIDFIKKALAEVEREGIKSIGDKIYWYWSEHYDNWICFFQPLLRRLPELEKTNSMLILRWAELQNILLWIWINVLYGRYHPAIRELRYILESIIQAYYIDVRHPKADIYCKLEILKEISIFGGRLIQKTDLEHKEEIKKIYSDLSQYVHGSYEELKDAIEEGNVATRVTFAFDLELFNKCKYFTDKVMDVSYFILLGRYPWLKESILDKEMTLKNLELFHCKMTLNLLKAKQEP